MKSQWLLLITFIFAIIVAIFAIANVTKTPVNYIFGEAEWPLILVILGATLLGILLSASFGLYRAFNRSREVKHLKKELLLAQQRIADLETSAQNFVPVNEVVSPTKEEIVQIDPTLTIDTETKDLKKPND